MLLLLRLRGGCGPVPQLLRLGLQLRMRLTLSVRRSLGQRRRRAMDGGHLEPPLDVHGARRRRASEQDRCGVAEAATCELFAFLTTYSLGNYSRNNSVGGDKQRTYFN